MALTNPTSVRHRSVPLRTVGLVAGAGVLLVVALVALALAVDRDTQTPSASSTRGSGVSAIDRREVAPFTGVELAGANTVVVHVGAPQAVAVSGDDNLVDRVTTVVQDGRLVIDDTGSFSTKAPMRVAVSVPALDQVALVGAGTVTVDGVTGADFRAELPGDGTLTVSGSTQRLTAVLAGAGTLDLHELTATDGVVRLEGTGTIRVHATATLDASLTGTGTILYRGHPSVTTRNTGTGTVVSE